MRRLAIVICILALSTPALAEIPQYDVDKHCKAVAAFGGGPSQMMLQSCYQQEQSSYDGLKPRWDALPKAIQAHCNQVARFGGPGSYMMLVSCVQQEEASANANSGFKFKR